MLNKIGVFIKSVKLITALLVLFPILAFAQPIKSAQKAMDQYDYPKAISILKEAIKDKEYKNAALPMLADCYRLQHDYSNARRYYAQAVALPDADPMTFLYYGQSLQYGGDYIHARDMYRRYSAVKNDHKEKILLAGCDSVLGPWQFLQPEYEIRTVSGINTFKSDFGPAFTDGYLVYASDYVRENSPGKGQYERTGISYLDLMKSKPVTSGDFLGKMGIPTQFDAKLNQEFHDGPACFSADGNTVYLTRSFQNNPKKENGVYTYSLKIFYATRTNGVWGEVKPFFLNSKEYSIGHPSLSGDGRALYFTSDMPGCIGGTDIWMCNRIDETWSTPVNLGDAVNTSGDEMFPYISEDGSLYFASDGHPGYGGLDIYKSEKRYGKWTAPENLHDPVNSSYDDFAIAYLPGTYNGFFSSNRKEGKGKDDIYAFRLLNIPEMVPVMEPPVAVAADPVPVKAIISKPKTDTVIQPEPLAQVPEPVKKQVSTPAPAAPTTTEVTKGSQSTPAPAVATATEVIKGSQSTPAPAVATATEVKKGNESGVVAGKPLTAESKTDNGNVSTTVKPSVNAESRNNAAEPVARVPAGPDLADNAVAAHAYITGVVKVIDKVEVRPVEGATVFVFDRLTHTVKVLKTGADGVYAMDISKPADLVVKATKLNFTSDCLPVIIQKANTAAIINAPRDLMLARAEAGSTFRFNTIYFDFDKYYIRADAKPELDKVVRVMAENPVNLEIASHTDSRGSFDYNEHLSQLRANSVANYIVARDISRSRISAKGYGEYQLLNKCANGVACTAAEHRANRRTELKVTGYDDAVNSETVFNPDQFKAGESISERVLPDAFFVQCASGGKIIPPSKPMQYVAQSGSQNLLTGNGLFTVQFATGFVSTTVLETITGTMMHEGSDGILRYYTGRFSTRDEARALKAELVDKGFTDAWIATIDDKRPAKH